MNLRSKLPLFVCLLYVSCLIAAHPAWAQQSPVSPRERPALGTSRGLGGGAGGESRRGLRIRSEGGLLGGRNAEQQGGQQGGQRPPGPGAAAAGGTGGGASTIGGATPGESATGGTTPPAPRSAGAGSGGARMLGGGAAGGGAARMTGGGPGAISVAGQGAYEPLYLRDVEYDDVPEGGELITLEGPMPCGQFLQAISLSTNWDYLVTPAAQTIQLEFLINEKTPQAALEILKFHKIHYRYDKETKFLYVMTNEEWLTEAYGKLKYREFQVVHADITYIESILSSLMSGLGRMISDQRTGRIYVWDVDDNLEQMVSTVEQLDVPLKKREFTVHHADLADIEGVIATMISPNGSVLSDGRTGQIFVWDGPTALERVAEAVERLDVPVESKTFSIKYINAEDLTDSLEAVISERGLVQVDPRFNTIVVTDLPNRIERMAKLIETLDQKLDTRTWTINYADIDFIADQIESYIPSEMGEVIVQEEVHQITVTGLPERLDELEKLISVWDVKRKQVQIEAFIVAVGSDVERDFNINWSYFGQQGNAPIFFDGGTGFVERGGDLSIGQLPYAVPAYSRLELDENGNITRKPLVDIDGGAVIDAIRGNSLAVTIDYLDKKNKATVLASPRVTVQDGEEANFESTTQVPFVSGSTSFVGGGLGSNVNNTNRIEFIDVGTILSVLPRITSERNVLLDIAAEDSTAESVTVRSNDLDSTVPQKTQRRAETQVRVHSGDTVVLGGLRQDSTGMTETRTPVLGDLPLIGRIFRYPNKSSRNSSLLIFITPTIVDEFTSPESARLAKVEDEVTGRHRFNEKDLWGRLSDKISKGRNELNVAIGQGGAIHAEGSRVSIAELRRALFDAGPSSKLKVIVRRHALAPQEVVSEVTEAVLEADLKLEFDDRVSPFVPNYRDEAPDTADAAPL